MTIAIWEKECLSVDNRSRIWTPFLVIHLKISKRILKFVSNQRVKGRE